MLRAEDLEALRAIIPDDPDRTGLLETLRARAAPWLATPPIVPEVKALLSRDGGFCPDDGTTLRFDPASPEQHQCPRCGKRFAGDRHHRNWARGQHLWLAERTAELSLLAALTGDAAAATRAQSLLERYSDLYPELPNRDNVLGPSHLFFSTYLESLWLTSYLAGAVILREAGLLPDQLASGIDRVAEEAAAVIGEFNEGFSNRQTWHAAALTAIAVWFEDAELAASTVESRTGLLGHLTDGFGDDGLWWEGENYHVFALRGLMQGLHWARAMGFDLLEDAALRQHFRAALLGPARSALPDFTYPARRDSRYGVSLAQPASLELWEIGNAWLGADETVASWLQALYTDPRPLPPAEHYDAWLHDAGRPLPARYSRDRLSWWALAGMGPPPGPAAPWRPDSVLLDSQGLGVLRHGAAYASLECGREIGGHGHPDRLHLTVHTGGVHWLPDQGTGAYVHPKLEWYRSALAHNAPLLDGKNAGGADAWCSGFAQAGDWAWVEGKAGELKRTLVSGPDLLLDRLELDAPEARELLLPWHFQGDLAISTEGAWEPATLEHPFVSAVERFVPRQAGSLTLLLRHGDASLRATLDAPGAELLRAVAPGLPFQPDRPFLLLRGRAATARWETLLEPEVTLPAPAPRIGVTRSAQGLRLTRDGKTIDLGGVKSPPARPRPLFDQERTAEASALAPRVANPPALDGTLAGFDLSAPLLLDSELQYRRSELPYDPERFSARAWANWDDAALYLAVEVAKPELCLWAPAAPALDLDNDPEDLNADGIQVYLALPAGEAAFLLDPIEGGAVLTRPIGSAAGALPPARWAGTRSGYRLTAAFALPGLEHAAPGTAIGFDLLVNEMQPGRVRRAGQLVWSGAGGWIYLHADRRDTTALGSLELS